MSEKINVNTADADALATLTGIGPELAQRIVEYRDLEGTFDDIFELVAVPGISARMVRGFEDEVMLSETGDDDVDKEMVEDDRGDVVETAVSADPIIVEDTGIATEDPVETPPPPPTKPSEEAIAENIQIEPTMRETNATQDPTSPQPTYASNGPDNSQLESRAQRRGCFSIIAGAIFGAILGATLTLVLLASLNDGNLEYNAQDASLQSQLNREIEQRTEQLETINTQLNTAATQEAELMNALATSSANVAEMETFVAETEATVVAMDERVGDIAGTTENFNLFLVGLHEILDELQPTLEAAATTATVTATNTAVSSSTPTVTRSTIEATPTNTAVRATRTPRPTATALFTSTPAPQP